MSTATNGRAREHRVRDLLTARGWTPIMRAAGSKGAGDLLMAHPVHGGALVQVGTAKSKRLGVYHGQRDDLAASGGVVDRDQARLGGHGCECRLGFARLFGNAVGGCVGASRGRAGGPRRRRWT